MNLLLNSQERQAISSLLDQEIMETVVLIRHTSNYECKDDLKARKEFLKELKYKIDCIQYKDLLN